MENLHLIAGVMIWFVCFILILLILVQGGTGDVGSTFGGGGQLDSTLGVGASQKMGKITGWLSVVFLLCVLVMAIPAQRGFGDLPQVDGAVEDAAGLVPATSAAAIEPLADEGETAEMDVEAEGSEAGVEGAGEDDETAAETDQDAEQAAQGSDAPAEPAPDSTGELDLDEGGR